MRQCWFEKKKTVWYESGSRLLHGESLLALKFGWEAFECQEFVRDEKICQGVEAANHASSCSPKNSTNRFIR
jgi:hypothetical protein